MAPGDSKGGPCCFFGSVICKSFIVVFYDYKEEKIYMFRNQIKSYHVKYY